MVYLSQITITLLLLERSYQNNSGALPLHSWTSAIRLEPSARFGHCLGQISCLRLTPTVEFIAGVGDLIVELSAVGLDLVVDVVFGSLEVE